MPTEQQSLEDYKRFHDNIEQKLQNKSEDLGKGVYDQFIETVKDLEVKPYVATGRKAGRDRNTPLQSLKVQRYVKVLESKRQEVNEVERILDERKDLKHGMFWNPAIIYLNPSGKHFLEEAILLENLRKIQHK